MKRQQVLTASLLTVILTTLVGCDRSGHAPRPEADTPLTIAAVKGDAREIQRLLDQGTDVNGRDSHGYTALVWTARSGQTEAMKILLDAGADKEMRKCPRGSTALYHAVSTNNNEAVHLLLARGADANGGQDWCEEVPAERRQPPVDGWPPLMMAISRNNAEVVQALLDKDADPHWGNNILLSAALARAWDPSSSFGKDCPTETVKALLEKAPDLKLKDDFQGRNTPLMARLRGCSETAALLREQTPSRQIADAK